MPHDKPPKELQPLAAYAIAIPVDADTAKRFARLGQNIVERLPAGARGSLELRLVWKPDE